MTRRLHAVKAGRARCHGVPTGYRNGAYTVGTGSPSLRPYRQ